MKNAASRGAGDTHQHTAQTLEAYWGRKILCGDTVSTGWVVVRRRLTRNERVTNELRDCLLKGAVAREFFEVIPLQAVIAW